MIDSEEMKGPNKGPNLNWGRCDSGYLIQYVVLTILTRTRCCYLSLVLMGWKTAAVHSLMEKCNSPQTLYTCFRPSWLLRRSFAFQVKHLHVLHKCKTEKEVEVGQGWTETECWTVLRIIFIKWCILQKVNKHGCNSNWPRATHCRMLT